MIIYLCMMLCKQRIFLIFKVRKIEVCMGGKCRQFNLIIIENLRLWRFLNGMLRILEFGLEGKGELIMGCIISEEVQRKNKQFLMIS